MTPSGEPAAQLTATEPNQTYPMRKGAKPLRMSLQRNSQTSSGDRRPLLSDDINDDDSDGVADLNDTVTDTDPVPGPIQFNSIQFNSFIALSYIMMLHMQLPTEWS